MGVVPQLLGGLCEASRNICSFRSMFCQFQPKCCSRLADLASSLSTGSRTSTNPSFCVAIDRHHAVCVHEEQQTAPWGTHPCAYCLHVELHVERDEISETMPCDSQRRQSKTLIPQNDAKQAEHNSCSCAHHITSHHIERRKRRDRRERRVCVLVVGSLVEAASRQKWLGPAFVETIENLLEPLTTARAATTALSAR